MKTTAALAVIASLAIFARAELFEFAVYRGTLTAHGTSNPISVQCLNGSVVGIFVTNAYSAYGTFTERGGVRQISIQTATNSFVGTIKNGVVRGHYKHFTSGATGTFQCDPPQ